MLIFTLIQSLALVRERGVMSIDIAIHKMTGLAASHYSLADRSLLRPGYRTDVAVLDPEIVTDVATFEAPSQAIKNIEGVWVNSQRVCG